MGGLFKLALGLEDPLCIRSVDFDVGGRRLDVVVGFERGSRFVCSVCGKGDWGVHDTIERTWRHLNFFSGLNHTFIVKSRVLIVKGCIGSYTTISSIGNCVHKFLSTRKFLLHKNFVLQDEQNPSRILSQKKIQRIFSDKVILYPTVENFLYFILQ